MHDASAPRHWPLRDHRRCDRSPNSDNAIFDSLSVWNGRVVALEDVMVSTNHFRHELLAQMGRAATQGRIDVLIDSGELCRSISNSSSVACCYAREFKLGDTLILDRSNGAGMTVRYILPRTIGNQISLPLKSN
jgi:hypothetical protein